MTKERRTTLKDIATAVGCSSGLVSYVLNGRGDEMRISKAMQQRVIDTARQMKYQSNIHDKSIREGVEYSPMFTFFWPYQVNTNLLNACFAGLHEVQRISQFEFAIVLQLYETHQLYRYQKYMQANRTNGALIFCASETDRQFLEETHLPIPTVCLNEKIEMHSCTYLDRVKLSNQVADLILQAGYRSVGLLGGWTYPKHRLQARLITEALRPHGIYISQSCFVEKPLSEQSGAEMIQVLLKEARKPPQLIVSLSDRVARGANYALQQAGYFCPSDVNILVMSDRYRRQESSFINWSVIQLPIDKMCSWSINKLLKSAGCVEPQIEAREFDAEFFLQDHFFI